MKRLTTKGFEVVNPNDRDWTHNRYILHFGAYGWTRLMVWGNSLDEALDEAIDWIADHAPGLLMDNEVFSERERLVASGMDDDRAMEQATTDMTCGGNCGNYIASWEWGIIAENPTREQIKQLQGEVG